MKTVTVTTQNAINYGAVLQAYGLHHTLRNLGVDDCLLDLDRTQACYYDKLVVGKKLPGILFNNLIKLRHKKVIKEKEKHFAEFVEENFVLTKNYKQMSEVLADPPIADIYITGGDQMFNYTSVLRPTNYLEFGDENIKRISYSTSLGKNEVMKGYEDAFRNKLSRYSHVSLREEKSKTFVENILGREVDINIDPTFLVDIKEWESLSRDTIKDKYILCYSLLNNEKLESVLNKLKRETGLNVIVINPQARSFIKGDKIIRNAGPREFLGLIKNAEWVVSTSFHGVCFSILFERPFYCLIKREGDIRYESLMEMFGLTHRIVNENEDIVPEHIDYSKIRDIIKKERDKSLIYLKKALED